jgi:hypothetical protein
MIRHRDAQVLGFGESLVSAKYATGMGHFDGFCRGLRGARQAEEIVANFISVRFCPSRAALDRALESPPKTASTR